MANTPDQTPSSVSSQSLRAGLRPSSTGLGRFPVFISYGDEARHLKQRIKRLVEEAINQQLAFADWDLHLPVFDWRDAAGQRAPVGGKTNDLFVGRARVSSVLIVILRDRIPPGTKEELEAVLDDETIQLTVFWAPRRRHFWVLRRWTKVGRFLKKHQDDFVYVELDPFGGDSTWLKLASNLVAILLLALRGQAEKGGIHVEQRPGL